MKPATLEWHKIENLDGVPRDEPLFVRTETHFGVSILKDHNMNSLEWTAWSKIALMESVLEADIYFPMCSRKEDAPKWWAKPTME